MKKLAFIIMYWSAVETWRWWLCYGPDNKKIGTYYTNIFVA